MIFCLAKVHAGFSACFFQQANSFIVIMHKGKDATSSKA
jgi:hypothetical protein